MTTPAPAPESPALAHRARVLVVDDDVVLCGLVVKMLERSGYTAVGAYDGRRATELLAAEPFDLVVTDLFMPGQEGIETIMQIRETHPHVRILAMSGSIDADGYSALGDAAKLGADRCLEKPFSVDALVGAVRELLGSR